MKDRRKMKWSGQWPYWLAALVCGTVFPLIGCAQLNNLDLSLTVSIIIEPLFLVGIGCIFSAREKRFDWSLPLLVLVSHGLVTLIWAWSGGVTQGVVYLWLFLLACLPAVLLLVVELFFLLVRKLTTEDVGWGYYFILYVLCVPLGFWLDLTKAVFFPWLLLAQLLACAAVACFLGVRGRRMSFALPAWALLCGLQQLLLHWQSFVVGFSVRTLVLGLLPAVAVLAAGLIIRLTQRRAAQNRE